MKFHEWILDKRVVRQNIRRGSVSRVDYQKYISSLPDLSANVAHDDPTEWASRATPRSRDDDADDVADEGGGD